jgi:EAL domain-containing protein (putative c-di-GMP-specific phosphodiesterase class I)/GAF domain-containing protein
LLHDPGSLDSFNCHHYRHLRASFEHFQIEARHAHIGIFRKDRVPLTVDDFTPAGDHRGGYCPGNEAYQHIFKAMKPATTATQPPDSEARRLLALQSYEILDTPPERIFDEFAQLAASIIGTPIALVSFVAEQRQWFKAKVGMEVSQTTREIGFCTLALQADRVFVVGDAAQDARFTNNPLVIGGPRIRFYAGAPLITRDGHALGALCVLDTIPREFGAEHQEALRELARAVMTQLETRRQMNRFRRTNPTRQKTLGAIRQAIESNEFQLHYQTTVDVRSGHIAGLEALLRWNTADRGLITPAAFLPILEDSGLIIEVGDWVMHRAAADYREWLMRGVVAPRIAVNVAPQQLRHLDFVSRLADAVEGDGTTRVPLDIEVTEQILVEEAAAVILKLRDIQRLGVNIAVDDFGTGYSSLRHLARLPIDTLKIDRSFIATMTENPDEMGLVTHMINLAHSLGLKVVAEGVETEEQRRLLRLLRCDQMQGYFFGKAVCGQEMEHLLRQDQRDAMAEWQTELEAGAHSESIAGEHTVRRTGTSS